MLDPMQLLPSIISGLVVIVALVFTRGVKMGDKTVSGSVRIEGLETNFEDIKKTMEKNFDRLERVIESNATNVSSQLEKIEDRVNTLSQKTALYEFRLGQLEKNRNGGGKSAV